MVSLGFKSLRHKESEPWSVNAILAAFVPHASTSAVAPRGAAATRAYDLSSGQTTVMSAQSSQLSAGAQPATRRGEQHCRRSVGRQGLLGAAVRAAVQLTPDVRLGGAGAKQLEGVVCGDVLSVLFFGLLASQQRITERVDDRVRGVYAARANDASERRKRLAQTTLHAQRAWSHRSLVGQLHPQDASGAHPAPVAAVQEGAHGVVRPGRRLLRRGRVCALHASARADWDGSNVWHRERNAL